MTFTKTATLITGNINQSQSIQQSVTLQLCSTKTARGPACSAELEKVMDLFSMLLFLLKLSKKDVLCYT